MAGLDEGPGDESRRGLASDAGFAVALLLVVAGCAAGGTVRCHAGTETLLWAACVALTICAAAIALASRHARGVEAPGA